METCILVSHVSQFITCTSDLTLRQGSTRPRSYSQFCTWKTLCATRRRVRHTFSSSAVDRCCFSFDVELPCNCDDDYWEHPDPERAFTQPPGKPSQMDFFLNFIKLNQILAFTLRTIASLVFSALYSLWV